MRQLKKVQEEKNLHFFDEKTMHFFNSEIETTLLVGDFFITSEKRRSTGPKKFTIRRAKHDGRIDTISEFMEFDTLKEAKKILNTFIRM